MNGLHKSLRGANNGSKIFHITKDVDGLVARGIHAYHYWGLVKFPNKILTKQCSPKFERKFTLIARRISAQRFKK